MEKKEKIVANSVSLKIEMSSSNPFLTEFIEEIRRTFGNSIKIDTIENLEMEKPYRISVYVDDKNILHFLGIPKKREVEMFKDILEIFLNRDKYLNKKISRIFNKINEHVWLTVFISPLCPYCPIAVRMLSKISLSSGSLAKVFVIDSMDNPDLVEKYKIRVVPTIFITKDPIEKAKRYDILVGAFPEEFILERIVKFFLGI